MRNKQFLIRALVLLNIVLGVVLVMGSDQGTQAYAQARRGGGSYAAGTGFYEVTTEAVWLLNASTHELAVLLPNQQSGKMRVVGVRNVEEDAR